MANQGSLADRSVQSARHWCMQTYSTSPPHGRISLIFLVCHWVEWSLVGASSDHNGVKLHPIEVK